MVGSVFKYLLNMEIEFEFDLGWVGTDFFQFLWWHKLYMVGNLWYNFSTFLKPVLSLIELQYIASLFLTLSKLFLFSGTFQLFPIKALNYQKLYFNSHVLFILHIIELDKFSSNFLFAKKVFSIMFVFCISELSVY